MKSLIFLWILIIFIQVRNFSSKIVPIIGEEVENCASPEEDVKLFDLSEYELIALSDYEVFLNGSIKILKNVESPVPLRIYAERFDRNQWNVMYYDTKRLDFCTSLRNPTEIWYQKLKNQKGCPLKPGVKKDGDVYFL